MWLEALDTVSHKVYFGTDPNSLAFKGNQANNIFDPATGGDLQSATTYYWKIDEEKTGGGVMAGDIWSFTTE